MTVAVGMAWSSAIGTGEDLESCIADAAAKIRAGLGTEPVDLVIAFVSSTFRNSYERVPRLVTDALRCRHLVGCSGGGVIGGGQEVEFSPAVSLTAARLPGVTLRPFHLRDEEIPDLDTGPAAWEEALGVTAADDPHFVLMVDPFSFSTDDFVMGLDFAFPAAAKVGGLASDAREPGGNGLFLDDRCWRGGLVGLAMWGDITVDTVVAQGCRPIGKPMVVTACERNLIRELDHQRPIDVLQDLLPTLDERDRSLLRTSLFLGIGMDARKTDYHHGDFLIRNVLALDRQSGVLAVGALLRAGQIVQFHLRDAETSAHDLQVVLEGYRARRAEKSPAAALLFSCMGRGEHLYRQPSHDSRMFTDRVGDIPLGGFFCNGEIGPVGGTTYVHGYTSCFGLFRPKA